MKEMYEKPMAEKIVFSYKEQVVAASGMSGTCDWHANNDPDQGCTIQSWTNDNTH